MTDRCNSTHPDRGFQCDLVAGHPGHHMYSHGQSAMPTTWDDLLCANPEPPEIEVIARALAEHAMPIAWDALGGKPREHWLRLARAAHEVIVAEHRCMLAEKQDRCIAELREIGETQGYAVAVHGSRERDLDVIATPWVQDAVTASELVEALCETLDLVVDDAGMVPKPHGRYGCVLHGRGQPIDLSIVGATGTKPYLARAAANMEVDLG